MRIRKTYWLLVIFSLAAAGGVGYVVVRAPSDGPTASPSVWSPPAALPSPPSVSPTPVASSSPTPVAENGLPPVTRLNGSIRVGKTLLYNLRISQRAVFITIDDGYVRDPRVLALIRTTHLPVSAFLTEQAVNADPSFWQLMSKAGVHIENHTVWHPNLVTLTGAQQQSQICRPQSRYEKLFGARPHLFRPPYGAFNATTLRAVSACGLRATILWDATYGGGKLSTYGGRGLRPGDIVLLHFRPKLYQDLVALIGKLRAQHLGVGSLEDFMKFTTPKVSTPSSSPRATKTPSPTPTPSQTRSPTASPTPSTSAT